MQESIRVYPDTGTLMRADHTLRLWGIVFLRLHYRVEVSGDRSDVKG